MGIMKNKKRMNADINEVNTIPLHLQINFIELRKDICGV